MRNWLALISLLTIGGLLTLGCPTTDDDDVADDDGADDDAGDDDSAGDDDGGDDDSAGGTPDINVHPPQVNFQAQCIGVPQTLGLNIENVGDAQLHVSGQLCDLAPVSFQEFVGNLPPGGVPVKIDLVMNCTVEGEQEGMFRIFSSDPDENPVLVPLLVQCQAC
jgi:hypothetical protein